MALGWVRRLIIMSAALLLCLMIATPALAQTEAASDQRNESGGGEGGEEGQGEQEEGGQQEASEVVRGILRQPGAEGEDDKPIEGAEIVVRSDGEEVGRATTDAEGRFEIGLPGPGEYEAELLTDTLPEDATLANEDGNVLRFSMAPGQSRPLLYRLAGPEGAEGAGGGGGTQLRSFLQLAVEGLKLGLIIAVTSIGLSLIFGTTGLVNFAHGEMVSYGAIMAY
jgi:neutral amino acid transport system permease protein